MPCILYSAKRALQWQFWKSALQQNVYTQRLGAKLYSQNNMRGYNFLNADDR